MGVFGESRKRVPCRAGELTQIVFHFGRAYPQEIGVRIVGDDGEPVTGVFREIRHFWIFPETPNVGALAPELTFHRRWIDGIYRIAITPDRDCVAHIA